MYKIIGIHLSIGQNHALRQDRNLKCIAFVNTKENHQQQSRCIKLERVRNRKLSELGTGLRKYHWLT